MVKVLQDQDGYYVRPGPDSGYKTIADHEPKNDPAWKHFKDEMGIENPPDSYDDIDILDEYPEEGVA